MSLVLKKIEKFTSAEVRKIGKGQLINSASGCNKIGTSLITRSTFLKMGKVGEEEQGRIFK